jgi:hypothetical protein
MRTNYQYGDCNKRYQKFLMAVICGPTFAIVLFIFMYLITLIPESAANSLKYVVWPAAATGCGILAAGADRLGKRLNLTAQEFAGPVAFSCTFCATGLYALLWLFFSTING